MSIRIMTMVFENRELSSTEKLIMLALADHANDEGKSIYPSQSRLSLKTGLARGTINKHIQKLIEAGYLKSAGYRSDMSNVLELEIQKGLLIKGIGVTEDDTSLEECSLSNNSDVTQDDTSDQADVTEDDTQVSRRVTGGVTEDDTNHHFKHHIKQKEVVKGDPAKTDELLLSHFEEVTRINRPIEMIDPYQLTKWIKEVGKWTDMGATQGDITEAVKQADERGTTLSWPGSITSYLTSEITRRKRGVKDTKDKKANKTKKQKSNDEIIEEMIENGEL